MNEFDETFKYFKRNPDLTKIINFHEESDWDKYEIISKNIKKEIDEFDLHEELGLKNLHDIKILQFNKKPGLLVLPNPFTAAGQQKWILRCLRDYTKSPPYKLNLQVHLDWKSNANWWELICSNSDENKKWKRKLRWSTLGYHHNWDTKVYSEDYKSEFPQELKLLSYYLLKLVGFNNFNAEAAIVNYYNMDSTLSGHTDHSEQNHSAPLLSVSFGQSAVFLIGGHTKNEKPLAILIESGDVLIMSGECRLSYHGIPKIIKSTNDNSCWKREETKFTNSWLECEKYLKDSRINLNIRQVLLPENKCL